MQIKNYTFNISRVTAIVVDTTTNNYLWIAFAKSSDDGCVIQKVSANDLSQIYYEFTLPVDEITDLHVFDSYLYVTVDDATNFFYKIGVSSPLSDQTEVTIPVGINEVPISIIDDGTDLYVLLPGSAVGENSKICKYDDSPSFVETIDLTAVNDAVAISLSGSDLWAVTSESPSNLVRVHELSGGIYTYTVTSLS